ncbi:hypothetical protein GQX74_007085 [Glossina fuscipes]|nr:hypothetical protein GQX74_007085 [Glossina fuscipes]
MLTCVVYVTCEVSNKRASGKSCKDSNASHNSSLHISVSSPERQARLRKKKEKFKAALVHTRAKPSVARSPSFRGDRSSCEGAWRILPNRSLLATNLFICPPNQRVFGWMPNVSICKMPKELRKKLLLIV